MSQLKFPMQWKKLGLIYSPKGVHTWSHDSCITPTPIDMGEFIRVYFGTRDKNGVSRIGFADLDRNNITNVIKASVRPALDIGNPGCFDDNGVILGDIVKYNNQLYMFYVGFQLVDKVKFLAFSGLAVSDILGENFTRIFETPILDRSDEGRYIRAIHSVHYKNDQWYIWYAAGNTWNLIEDKYYPNYNIRYLTAKNLLDLPKQGNVCLNFSENEYRIGRPRVYQHNNEYFMLYTKGKLDKSYLPGIAISSDEKNWKRCDDMLGIALSVSGWDSNTLCYPSLIKVNEKMYMFYNGNDMGKDGFGAAELID